MRHRFTDQLLATLGGTIIGVVMMGLLVPDAWVTVDPAARPAPHADPSPGGGMTTDATPGVPSPDVGGLAGRPDALTAAAIGTRPAPPTVAPDLATLRGIATWYDNRRGHAAAGPELRRALGTGWRGSTVRVSHGGRSVVAILSDWCGCPGGRVVDLDRFSFAALADPSRGVLPVTVTWPATHRPDRRGAHRRQRSAVHRGSARGYAGLHERGHPLMQLAPDAPAMPRLR